ncbi:MAG: transglycosylase [Jatrophihabitantaceae bacterium]|nr:transglycosylase [Jatrophihabitantaceae bacterium]
MDSLLLGITSAADPRRVTRSSGGPAMLGLIISLIIIGLIAGAIARLLVPGRQSLSIPMTILIGIIGSFVGGFLGYLIFHKDSTEGALQPSGIIGSIIGAVIVLLIWTRVGSRSTVR